MLRAADRAYVEAAIKRQPELADALIAGRIGSHRNTVREARRRLVERGEIPDLPDRVGGDGRRYPARRPRDGAA